jgi:hypothetical protein
VYVATTGATAQNRIEHARRPSRASGIADATGATPATSAAESARVDATRAIRCTMRTSLSVYGFAAAYAERAGAVNRAKGDDRRFDLRGYP